jgi:hypothetical protein
MIIKFYYILILMLRDPPGGAGDQESTASNENISDSFDLKGRRSIALVPELDLQEIIR